MIMLPEFYETHLKRELGHAEYLVLKILINLLQSIKTVSIELGDFIPLTYLVLDGHFDKVIGIQVA
ncbi:hypothetical protein [Nostoc sp.]|uniref:hypothetical protein n=1 Tax=Nostoc sp. TaxID=1180 RepID=UPI003FA5FDFE